MAKTKNTLPGLVKIDPWLESYTGDIWGRLERFNNRLHRIELEYGSLDHFASAYEYYGIHYSNEDKCWIYREWAPGAHALFLTGDFNDWNKYSHPLHKNIHGDWEIRLPYHEYKESFKHESRIKVLVQSESGEQLRIPAYIFRAIQDEATKDFSGQLWFPGKFNWKGDRFKPRPSEHLFIYEAHVGMAQEKAGIGTYNEFTENILPRIKKDGYNAIQLMAVQEHPYYGSFGYHVSNLYAPSSRFGTPEDLKMLIRTAHEMGIAVIMDIVHSHAVKNINEGLNLFDGTEHQYFHPGERGEHPDWDSKLFDYGKKEVLQFLLSNIRYWIKEFHFDGFRFDGVGSMLYFHHGHASMDSLDNYFREGVEFDAVTYLSLANLLTHKLKPNAVTIAEDVTGMPGLTIPEKEGGLGFDYRLGMGLPDFWIRYVKELPDENWNIYEIWDTLNNRIPYVKTVSYCESHDQALVGDKTLAFWLMDKEMYFNMHIGNQSLIVDRGIALHKLIRLLTITMGGQAYLNFMGNEFGHPEWIDFPREGNNWSYQYARRQWSLADNSQLRYQYLLAFDNAMIGLFRNSEILNDLYAQQINMDTDNQCIICSRGKFIFAFNLHVDRSIPSYRFRVPGAGNYKVILNTDNSNFGGFGRIDEKCVYPAKFQPDMGSFVTEVYLPNRTALVLCKTEA